MAVNVLFVCKHNMFRSKVSEAYFKKLNKNKHVKASSAGPVKGYTKLDKREVAVAKKLGIRMVGRPRGLSYDLLRKQDVVVNTADDVPSSLLRDKRYMKKDLKLLTWSVSDANASSGSQEIEKIIRKLMKKVEVLVKQLERSR